MFSSFKKKAPAAAAEATVATQPTGRPGEPAASAVLEPVTQADLPSRASQAPRTEGCAPTPVLPAERDATNAYVTALKNSFR